MTDQPAYDVNGPLPDWVRKAARFADDPVAVARELRPLVERSAAEQDAVGRLSPEPMRALCESGLLGILVPREMGGIEAAPGTYIDVIEELSYADGSFGWVTMATTFAIKGAAAYLGPRAIDAIFEANNGFIAAGQIAPNGIAERVADGYRVSGQFHFGSGAQLASWFMGAFVLHQDGAPVSKGDGTPEILWAFGPREKIFIDPTSWDVTGLRATASCDFQFLDQIVDDDFVMSFSAKRRRGGATLDIGPSMGHVAWSLGAGMRILDEIQALATRKQRLGRATLIDQPTFQRDFAMMHGAMTAARSYVRAAFDDWHHEAQTEGTAGLETRAKARIAACWGTRVATEVAQFAFTTAGSDGLRNGTDNRLQRCARDIEASAAHRHVDDNVLVDAASVLLGVNAPTVQL